MIGTHLIPACMDHGIPEIKAASLLAVMGIFDLAGTTFSGWLTERFNSRYLLFWYYTLPGLSLLFLPYSLLHPTSGLSVYGWIGAAHQLGASLAAITAGSIRTYLGDYRDAFWLSGGLCLLAATLLISTRTKPAHKAPQLEHLVAPA